MQSSGRTPSSILRKRAADEQNQRRRSLRAKGGRRVSFAPDDELETMHLFQKDKQSPLPSQDTQPLAELAQNQLHPPTQDVMGGMWHEKPLDQFGLPGHDQFVMQSPGSPMSMELTNDTLQQQAGLVPFAASENDSFTFNAYGAAAPGMKDGTQNITDNVPGLSTLVEEDEDEVYNDTSTEPDGSAMELTGTTDAAQLTSPRGGRPNTRRSSAAAAAAASPAQPSPAMPTRSSSSRSSKQGTAAAASPAASTDLTSPRSRGRRSSTGGSRGKAAAAGSDMQLATPDSATAEIAAPAGAGGRHLAPSMELTPSPLRRVTRSMSPLLGGTEGFTEGLLGDGDAGAQRSRRSTINRFADQQNKWGFVPGEEDTLMLDMDMPGVGGLGEATLHHVYAESAGTGELTMSMRTGQLQHHSLPAAAAPAAARPNRRRSSVGRHQRGSLAAEVIPEEAVTPAAAEAATPAAAGAGPDAGEMTEDMAISPDCTPGLLGQRGQQHGLQQQQLGQVEHETPGAAAAAQDADGLTTNLLLDDRSVGAWGHVPLAHAASCGTTGRGSVGSNVPTMHLRGGHTTQLLADGTANPLGVQQPLFPRSSNAALGAFNGGQEIFGAPAGAHAAGAAAGYEECTTKLLADSTAASSSGMMGMFPMPRSGLLGGTIAGGAPVVEPLTAVQQQQQQGAFASPGLAAAEGTGVRAGPFGSPAIPAFGAPEDAAGTPEEAAAAADPAADLSPVAGWQGQQQELTPSLQLRQHQQYQQQHARMPSASPELPAAAAGVGAHAGASAADGSEPTMELAGAVSHGGQTNALEDATLEDFAMPPDLAAGEERPITMPFSGALSSLAANDCGAPGSVARTPGGSIRQAQPITFSDFCQIVDMQFLTHIRRGTSICVMDFQPSSVPQDLGQALQLLAVTSCEVAVLEGAMHQLQAEMHNKRRDAYELEDRLGVENPPVFAAVQTARHTQLEQTKHCLVLLKKSCRALTAASWKQLRSRMEQELAERLGQQQADLEEQLAYVQGKLQKAQQQREYAKAFHADVLKKMAADEAAHQEAAAARARLVSLRARLAELRGLNADRQQRAQEVQAQVETLRARCAEVDAETAALLARREQLAAAMAATPKPAQSRQALDRLSSATQRLELATGLQGWRPESVGAGEWLMSFKGRAGIRLSLPTAAAAAGALATGSLEVVAPQLAGPTAAFGVEKQLLSALVAAMQGTYSFQVAPALLPLAFSKAELALGRAVKLAEQCREMFSVQPLLASIGIVNGSSAGGAGGSDSCQGWLSLTLIEADQQVKVNVLLELAGLLTSSNAGIASKVEVVVCPDAGKAEALQQQLGRTVSSVLAAATRRGSSRSLLERVCVEASSCLVAGQGSY